MKVTPTEALPEVMLVEPRVFGDDRGFFMESWSRQGYAAHGIDVEFVQDNISRSGSRVLRGLHLQHPFGQGKLVSVVEGEVFDVCVDVRVGSPRFGRWTGHQLSAANKHQLWIPPGFAHGFCVVSETALFAYKCSEAYHPETERCVLWNDPAIGIEWPISDPILSPKDAKGTPLAEIPEGDLPSYDG